MRITIHKKRTALIPLIAGALALAGCTNDDYDFNEVDSTLGIGSGELTLPVSSTDFILLDDVLDIDDTECVILDENKNYVFHRDGGDVEPARPNIDRIEISKNGEHDNRVVPFQLVSGAKGHGVRRGAAGSVAVAEGTLNLFTYEGDKPEEVMALYEATSESSFKLDVFFSDELKNNVAKLKTLTLSFSRYMVLSNLTVSQPHSLVNGYEIRLENVNPKAGVHIAGNVRQLDFRKGQSDPSLGTLTIDEASGKITLDGQVNVRAEIDMADVAMSGQGALSSMTVRSELALDRFVVTGATGRFEPKIDLDDLGDTEVGDVPSFLKDGNVVIDLFNPQIVLELSNDMDVEGDVSGTITAYKDGNVIVNDGRNAVVNVSGIHINRHPQTSAEASTVTRVCICRNANAMTAAERASFDVIKEVDNLSDLIRTIPDRVTFNNVLVKADATKDGSFKMGYDYTVGPKYSINAPLSFAEDARIVYTDSIDDWNGDLEDFDLADGAYVQLTANIENRVPLFLTVKAEALAVGGELLGDDKVSVEVDRTIIASSDGTESGNTPIVITIRPKKKGAIKELDGLAVTFEGDASMPGAAPVTGVVLNAEKHYIKATDIRVKVVGTVMAEL